MTCILHYCCSAAKSCLTLCNPMGCSRPVSSVLLYLLEFAQKFMSTELVMLPNHLILCHPLLLLPSVFPSIRVFPNESALCVRWPKYWRFSFNISLPNEYSGLISFKIDWFDFLAVQGTLTSLFQHHSSKASILWHSVFFMVRPSHPYMIAGKIIALTRRTFVGKVMSLVFNMPSRFVIAFFQGASII